MMIKITHFMMLIYLYVKSTVPVELTSHEEEYRVKAVKHIFDAYVVIEYNCSHKFAGVTWKNVRLACIDNFARNIHEALYICLIYMCYCLFTGFG